MDETSNRCNHQDESRVENCCPLCAVMAGLKRGKRSQSGFFTHMYNARIEMLQAFKSLIDQQISCLEKRRDAATEEKKATRIEVE